MFMIRGRVLLYVCFDRGIKDADVDDMLFLMFLALMLFYCL